MPIQAAVVGCGSFGRAVHLPNLQASPEYELRAAVDIDLDLARRTADQFGAYSSSADYNSVLSDSHVELVVICTQHFQHAAMALDAVNAGKHVLVEKPMAMKLEELRPIVDAVRRQGVTFTVGFNRRYSPVSRRAKELLKGRTYPLVINYRMVDEIWRHPWALDPEKGGGRIVSEAVHLFDFCTYMIGAEPIRVFAEGGALTHPEVPETQDNAVMTLRFADGSMASLTIGDLGNAEYPKERIELFSGERTMLIDDFQRLETHGFGDEQDLVLPAVDKGQVQELAELAEAIQCGSAAPVTEIDGARATLCAVKAVEAVRTGQAQDLDLPSVVGDL